MVIQGAAAEGSALDFPLQACYTALMNEKPRYPNPFHPDDPAKWSPVTNSWVFTTKYELDKEMQRDLWSGRLSQVCPYCQNVEPAGGPCSKCLRQVSPDNYVKQQSLTADGKKRRGRPSKSDLLAMVGARRANTT